MSFSCLLLGGGLIPAHAGKIARRPGARDGQPAHPRSRGENAARRLRGRRQEGSSPLTRGKSLMMCARSAWERLIPAHAGKMVASAWRRLRPWAHPRSRGENCAGIPHDHPDEGSSPLTRGKSVFIACDFHECGLIPAHAGKIHESRSALAGPRAHPRSRGENLSWLARLVLGQGSSPLTRGKSGRLWQG